MHVVYIAGYGASGSTILNLCLGNHSEIISIGEIKNLSNSYRNDSECSCGQPVRECLFWKSVEKKLQDVSKNPAISLEEWDAKPDHLGDPRTDTISMLKSIGDVSGKSLFVDSSKTIDQLERYARCSELRISVIHLIRHPFGVAASVRKRKRNGLIRLHEWKVRNEQIRRLLRVKKSRINFLFLRYEDFATNPRRWLGLIDAGIGVEFEDSQLSYFTTPHHLTSGSKVRRSLNQRLPISVSMDWTTNVPLLDRIYLGLTSFRFTKELGYRIMAPGNIGWVAPLSGEKLKALSNWPDASGSR